MRISALVSALLLLLAGCSELQPLAWLDTADATQMAAKDLAHQRYRFFSLCGYSCQVVGVGSINAQRCYPSTAVEIMEGTSDVILSEEQERLTKKAYAFATQYNLLVAANLEQTGKRQCGHEANWDGALHALTEYIWSLSDPPRGQGQVSIKTGKSVFLVALPSGIETSQVLPKLCGLVASHGLATDAALSIRSLTQPESEATEFKCSGVKHGT